MTQNSSTSSDATGEILASLTKPPISRHTLALYCGASYDHNPMHVDLDFAREHGVDDVFAHGMLSMGYLGELLCRIAGPEDIRSFSVRFSAIVPVGAEITCTARHAGLVERQGETLTALDLLAVDADGATKLMGSALIAINGKNS
ncbi:MAG: dehydratase [Sphingomonadaceae bacterium]|nr:dehydratase [Sphingomonadaceae bacterium]